ncbi:MAG: hypothetical protein IJZ16_12900 [Clostridia bacterium]|nr:hypothetical protein [Clostridia bacterium]
MKKAIITFVILFCISLFTTIVSFAVCGGELIKTGIDYGIEQYREFKAEESFNNVNEMIKTA